MKTGTRREFRRLALLAALAFCLLMPAARAERKYLFGFRTDVLSGVTNQAGTGGFSLSPLSEGYRPFYSVYPSVSLKSIGRRSTLDLAYNFTADRYEFDSAISALGHDFRSVLTSQLGRRARLRLDGSFSNTPQISTINVLAGFALNPQGGFGYVYDPQWSQNLYQRANGGGEIELDLTGSSFLTFAGSGSWVHFGGGASAVAYLSNQVRAEGSLAYSYRKGKHQTWGMKYSFHRNDFSRFGIVRSHSAILTHTSQLRPSLRLSIEAGPAFTEESLSLPEYLGYTASIYLTKTIHANLLTFNYSHRSGDSTGYGGVTESDHIGLGFSRALGRRTTLRMSATAFDQKQHSTSAYKYRGVGGSLGLTRTIGKHWQVGVGASYQDFPSQSGDYPTGGYPGRVYKRLYLSLGYSMPEFWRISK